LSTEKKDVGEGVVTIPIKDMRLGIAGGFQMIGSFDISYN